MTDSLYCKAYYASQLREYVGWADGGVMVRADLDDIAAPPRPLEDEDILFVHADYTVTDGLFGKAQTVFASPDPAWQRFCRESLDFAVPGDVIAAEATLARDLAAAGQEG